MIESDIVQDPEIATGGGPVPDPHTTGAAGDQGLHTTDEGGQGPVPVLHVGDIETTGVVPVPDRGHPMREGGIEIETERGGDQGIEKGIERGRGREIVAEIDVGHPRDDQCHQVLTALHQKNPSKNTNTFIYSSSLHR